jgi:hypothetical protein
MISDTFTDSDIKVFMPTSIAPWHPSINITYQAINSLRQIFTFPVHVYVYCDGLHPKASPEEETNYQTYKTDLSQSVKNVTLVEMNEWIGLGGLFHSFIDSLPSANVPLVFNLQHDWEFLNVDRIDLPALAKAMKQHDDIQVVRFHKRDLPQKKKYVDRQYYEVNENKYGVPLIATDGWGDSPQIARTEHYTKTILPHLSSVKSDDGRYGAEGPVWRAYKKDIIKHGFDTAQYRWGSFLYGRFGQGALVRHLGGAATRWRKQRGMEKGCLQEQ